MPTPDEVPGDLKLAGDVINAAQDVIDKISSDGRTADGTVGLAPSAEAPLTSARWQVSGGGGGSFILKSLSKIDGPHFLGGKAFGSAIGNTSINL